MIIRVRRILALSLGIVLSSLTSVHADDWDVAFIASKSGEPGTLSYAFSRNGVVHISARSRLNADYLTESYDGSNLAVTSRNAQGKVVIQRSDSATGQAKLLCNTNWAAVDRPSWHPDGETLYFGMGQAEAGSYGWSLFQIRSGVLPDANPEKLAGETGQYTSQASLSPDGGLVVYVHYASHSWDYSSEIWLAELDPGGTSLRNPRRLTDDSLSDHFPVFSPDGRYIYWSSHRQGGPSWVKRMLLDGTAQEEIAGTSGNANRDIGIVSLSRSGLVAYDTNDSGTWEVRVIEPSGNPVGEVSLDDGNARCPIFLFREVAARQVQILGELVSAGRSVTEESRTRPADDVSAKPKWRKHDVQSSPDQREERRIVDEVRKAVRLCGNNMLVEPMVRSMRSSEDVGTLSGEAVNGEYQRAMEICCSVLEERNLPSHGDWSLVGDDVYLDLRSDVLDMLLLKSMNIEEAGIWDIRSRVAAEFIANLRMLGLHAGAFSQGSEDHRIALQLRDDLSARFEAIVMLWPVTLKQTASLKSFNEITYDAVEALKEIWDCYKDDKRLPPASEMRKVLNRQSNLFSELEQAYIKEMAELSQSEDLTEKLLLQKSRTLEEIRSMR